MRDAFLPRPVMRYLGGYTESISHLASRGFSMKTAVFDTARGTITAELHDDAAPGTVANFEKLANSEFYDGTRFHRVIKDFVIQGGDPLSKDAGNPRVGTGGPGWTIKCETAGNPHKHQAGSLSMAHAGKDTGGSQFFIAHSPQPHLDGVHTVFGRVTDGLDVVNKIQQGDVVNSIRVS
jgi:peptidyl-prolyl cis-trans isomerase B (cyclophilin B)